MAVDRAHTTVESLIASHVAGAFPNAARTTKPEAPVEQIRQRITDNFQHIKLGSEQDNCPPAILQLRNRIIAAFSMERQEPQPHDSASRLAELKAALEGLRSRDTPSDIRSELEHTKTRLLHQRDQLALRNEFTEGFARTEMWLVALAFLGVVFLKDVNVLWAGPILAFGVARSWHLDRQCKRRIEEIARIDQAVEGM
jgi:hypothetical protein